jgi:hypothetical protein
LFIHHHSPAFSARPNPTTLGLKKHPKMTNLLVKQLSLASIRTPQERQHHRRQPFNTPGTQTEFTVTAI